MNRDSNKLPSVVMPTVTNYTLKEEMDLKKDKWLRFPLSSGIAVYAYDYMDKHAKKLKNKRKVN